MFNVRLFVKRVISGDDVGLVVDGEFEFVGYYIGDLFVDMVV